MSNPPRPNLNNGVLLDHQSSPATRMLGALVVAQGGSVEVTKEQYNNTFGMIFNMKESLMKKDTIVISCIEVQGPTPVLVASDGKKL